MEAAQGSQAARHSNSQTSHAGRGEQAQPWEPPTAKRQKRGATRSRAPCPRTRLARPLPKEVTRRLDVDLSNKELHPYQRADRSSLPSGSLLDLTWPLVGRCKGSEDRDCFPCQTVLAIPGSFGWTTSQLWLESFLASTGQSYNRCASSQPLECVRELVMGMKLLEGMSQ